MEGTLRIDIGAYPKVLTDRSERAIALDSVRIGQDPVVQTSSNGRTTAVLLTLVLTFLVLFTHIDRNVYIDRIERLEAEVHHQKALLDELSDSLEGRGRSSARVHSGTTEAARGKAEGYHRQLGGRYDVMENSVEGGDVIREKRDAESPQNVRSSRGQTTQSQQDGDDSAHARGVIHNTPSGNTDEPQTQPTLLGRKKKQARNGRGRDRQGRGDRPKNRRNRVNETSQSTPCDSMNHCNGSHHDVAHPLVAHFVPSPGKGNANPAGPRFVNATSDVLGHWSRAPWFSEPSHHGIGRQGFKIIGPNKSRVQVQEAGIYYVYSQVSFADQSFFLGHSIMVEGVTKFMCTFWATDGVVEATTCATGGLVKIRAGERVSIGLADSNRVIRMDEANTFFGLIRMVPLPPHLSDTD